MLLASFPLSHCWKQIKRYPKEYLFYVVSKQAQPISDLFEI